jgi:hypothetical protein
MTIDELTNGQEEMSKVMGETPVKKESNAIKYSVIVIALILSIFLLMIIFPLDKTDQQDCYRDISTCSDQQLEVFFQGVEEEVYGR